jgi:polyphosphate kinase
MSTTKYTYAEKDLYTNRELSWLDFNNRVLEEARDPDNPLLERCNFLGITQSNVDEFFMVRVASLNKLYSVNINTLDTSGMTPKEQIDAINEKEHQIVEKRYSTYNRSLLPQLAKNGIHIISTKALNDRQYEVIQHYFNDELYPVLTPMADDSSRPFPFLQNNSLNLAIHLTDEANGSRSFATLRIPDLFPRLVKLPYDDNAFILLEDIIREFMGTLFHGYKVDSVSAYRVIRDMDLDVAEQDTSDLLRAVQIQLHEREHGDVMRLEIENSMDPELCEHLIHILQVADNTVYRINGPIDLTFLKKLPGLVQGHDDLKFKPCKSFHRPGLSMKDNIFDAIRQKDFLMQHPYDSFDSVVNFIHQAARDENVLAIKMTLYRVSGNSPIIKYLGQAAQYGKQVTVLVEVKARFDEENNVRWSKQLERMGCHVIYGLVGLKTHSKIALVIRRDDDGIRRYLHLGTGNYNDVTARFYTDLGLFTCDRAMGVDATNIFNMLSGFSRPPYFHQLHISPNNIREFIYQKIDAEISAAQAGRPALIKMKMNSLSDPKIIERLYQASTAGVKIQLIVRGICCLRTNIPGISDNIELHSIVGRFLEHSRIYYFYNEGNEDIYLASADMMTRNLNRRVELMFPILQADLKKRSLQIFTDMWNDNIKSRILDKDRFIRINRRGLTPFNSQEHFIEQAARQNAKLHQQQKNAAQNPEIFQPMMKHDDDISLEDLNQD